MNQSTDSIQPADIARALGYQVSEDPDQPGRFQWALRDESGRFLEGCEQSLDSEGEAWDDATFSATSIIMGALDISDEQWDAMSLEQQVERAREALEEGI